MNKITMSLCAFAFAATPALAREGNPLTGVGVSVESSPGGIRTQFNNANDARAACVAVRGTFSNTPRGGLRCANPRRPLASETRIPRNLTAVSPVTVTNSEQK